MNTIVRLLTLILFAQMSFVATAQAQQAPTLNGFVLEDLVLPLEEMFIGGPTRENLAAVNAPDFTPAGEDQFLSGKDLVIGIAWNGMVRAYPARILNHHEIVNDRFGSTPVTVTYSPLSGSAAAFVAEIDGRPHSFEVADLVYNNNTLFFDNKTRSLWSQLLGQAVAGRASGQMLEQVPIAYTTWDNWKALYPNTLVMTRNTGFEVDYAVDSYAEYETSRGLRYPINKVNKLMPLKERVVGVEVNGAYRAYPMFVLQLENKPLIADTFNGQELLIRYDKESKTALVTNVKGEIIPTVTSYWYSWYAFHPDTDVYKLNDDNRQKPSDVAVSAAAVQR